MLEDFNSDSDERVYVQGGGVTFWGGGTVASIHIPPYFIMSEVGRPTVGSKVRCQWNTKGWFGAGGTSTETAMATVTYVGGNGSLFDVRFDRDHIVQTISFAMIKSVSSATYNWGF